MRLRGGVGGVGSGEYDPVKATIYYPIREDASNEPTVTGRKIICRRHVRLMSASTREAIVQGVQVGVGTQVFRVRRDNKTEQITHEFALSHRGRNYEFTGIHYPDLYEIEIIACRTEKSFVP
jgi:hypothetical protein